MAIEDTQNQYYFNQKTIEILEYILGSNKVCNSHTLPCIFVAAFCLVSPFHPPVSSSELISEHHLSTVHILLLPPPQPPQTHPNRHTQSNPIDSQTTTTTTMSLDTQSTHPYPPPTDAHTRLLSASCLDFLLIELVPMAERLAHEPAARGVDPIASDDNSAKDEEGEGEGDKTQTQTNGAGTAPPDDEETRREATFFRLEGLGYRVGQGLAER
jgi:hypothetical protein